MIVHTFNLPDNFDKFVVGDDHCGNSAISEKSVRRKVQIIEDNGAKIETFVSHQGDAVESIFVNDKRFSMEAHAGKYSTINAQVDYWLELYRPIHKQFLWLLDGNHEEKIHHIVNVGEMVGKQIPGLIHGGFSIVATLTKKFKIYAIHGSRSINSLAGSIRQRETNNGERLKRLLMGLRGDCHAMIQAHVHHMIIVPPSVELYIADKQGKSRDFYASDFRSDNGIIHPDSRWYACTGSSLRTQVEGMTTYSERYMYRPAELGMLKLIVRDKELQTIEKVILPKE